MTFDAFGLSEPILRALRAENFTTPTPIQAKAIPLLMNGADLMAIAQTGTGKTAAFGLPLLEKLSASKAAPGAKTACALVLVPTRELAVQVHGNLAAYAKHLKLRQGIVIGGVSMAPQTKRLAQGVHVLVATVGRLLDHVRAGHVKLDQVSMLVLDEADRMLDMGFINDVRKIAAMLPKSRQSAMFSATMAPEIAKLGQQILNRAERIEIAPSGATADRVAQKVMFVKKEGKPRLLLELLGDPAFSRTIIFTRTKRGADRVAAQLEKAGITSEALHGNKSQNARQRALASFSSGAVSVLVATDIAARGIDVDQVTHVINYELPDEAETYVHRIGRTARAGSDGVAVSFCDPSDRAALRAIEKLTGKPMIAIDTPECDRFADEALVTKADTQRRQNRQPSNRSSTPKPRRAEGGEGSRPLKVKLQGKASPQGDASMPSGTVKWFNPAKGFGFVEPDGGGKDVFLHISAFERSGIATPREGQRVSFEVERDQKGRLSATNLRAA